MPVPVRKGAPIGPDGKPAPLVIGPNTAVDLSGEPGSGFSFAEPTGMSLQRHQSEVEHVEALMDRSSLNFLYGANVKTATEASLRASQVGASVDALVRNKNTMFDKVMRLWAWYAGEVDQITEESGIIINDSLINKPLGASEMAQLVNLYSEGLMSKRTVLDELQRGGVIDPDLVVEEELARIDEDKTQKMEDSKATLEMEAEAQTTAAAPEPGGGEPSQVEKDQKAAEEAK
jgi:hypothetical protein